MADAQIKITADTSQAERALGSINRQLDTISSIVIGAGVAAGLVKIASTAQELTNKLISVSGSMDEANAKFYQLSAIAKTTGSDLGGTVDLFQKLAQSSTFAGSSTESLAQITSNFNKTLQISGASGQAASAALYQFAQAMQKGSLNGDEFRTIQETNGYLIKVLGERLGISQTELRQWASDGKLSAEIIAKALYENDKIAQDYGKTIRTIPQAFENLKTSLLTTIKALDDSTGASDKFVAVLEMLANNMDIIIGVASGFFAVFAVGRIIAVATAIYEIVAALRAMTIMGAMASGGLSLLVGAAAGAAAWYATGKAIDQAAEKTKKLTEEANNGLKITHQRTQEALDLDKALQQTIGTMKATNDLDAQATGMKSLQLDVARALAIEEEKYKKTGEAMLDVQKEQFKTETGRKILNAERVQTETQLLQLRSATANLSIMDNNEFAVGNDLEKFRLSVTQETFNLKKNEYELAVRQNKLAEANRAVMKDINDAMARTQVGGILDPRSQSIEQSVLDTRQKYGTAYTAELEKQHRILLGQNYDLDQQNQIRKTINDLTRSQTELETAQRAGSMFGGTAEGQAVDFGRQQDALKYLRDQGLISTQSYADQEVLIEQQKYDQILQLEQKVGEVRLKQAGVTNQAIIDSIKAQQENAKMIMQGGVVGAQGVLGALDNVMSQMGAQSQKAFQAHKALAIAQAVISTYQAAAQAIAMPPGPPLSFIYVAGAIAAGMAQVNAIKSQQYTGRALGGPVTGGRSYIVGENGPEMFTPGAAGNITPNNEMGTGSTNINFTIVANDTAGFDQLLTSRRGMIQQIVTDAMLEKGRRM